MLAASRCSRSLLWPCSVRVSSPCYAALLLVVLPLLTWSEHQLHCLPIRRPLILSAHACCLTQIMDRAMLMGVPVIGLNDSGGARIHEG